MKLVLFSHNFPPRFEGGTESVVRGQARALADRGHEVLVVSGTDDPHTDADVERDEVDGVPVAFLPRKPDEHFDLSLARPRLAPILEDLVGDADLCHVHHWKTLRGTLVADLARKRPVVISLHDYFLTCPRDFRLPVAPVERCPAPGASDDEVADTCSRCAAADAPGVPHELLVAGFHQRFAISRAEIEAASLVIVPSHAHGRGVGDHLAIPEHKLRVIPNGLSRPLPRLDVPEWTGEGTLRLLYLGHRTPLKGVGDLVDACAALEPAERARIELVLVGNEIDAGYDDELRARAGDLQLTFHPGYRPGELASYLDRLGPFHLALFPSHAFESYGLVPDELQALGFPVWVTDRGAPQERIGAAGRVLPAADPAPWKAALQDVIQTPSLLAAERGAVPSSGRTSSLAAVELEALYGAIAPQL